MSAEQIIAETHPLALQQAYLADIEREMGSTDGDTHLYTIKQFTRDELREHFDKVNQELFETLAQQEIQGHTDRSVTGAIAITN